MDLICSRPTDSVVKMIALILINVGVLAYAMTIGVLASVMCCRCVADGFEDAHRRR